MLFIFVCIYWLLQSVGVLPGAPVRSCTQAGQGAGHACTATYDGGTRITTIPPPGSTKPNSPESDSLIIRWLRSSPPPYPMTSKS
eukprot:15147846-Heterocapsa_arctica.AAC.1